MGEIENLIGECEYMQMEMKMLNKKVKVVQKDFYVKIGILRQLHDNFIVLEFFNGKEEIISFDRINAISEIDAGGDANGRK